MARAALIAVALVARAAAADPALGHVLTAPTAWLPEAGTLVGTAGLDHRGDGSLGFTYGLGELASVELGEDSDVRASGTPIRQGRAAFRIGAHQDAWFAGQPALALGVAKSFGGSTSAVVGEAYVVASRQLGPLALHAGAEAIDAREISRMGTVVRPTGGVELVPPQYPKTTLMVDLAWLPLVEPTGARPEWLIGWGVRYQALSWGSIELDVRHREDEGLAASTVFVRVNGVWKRAL